MKSPSKIYIHIYQELFSEIEATKLALTLQILFCIDSYRILEKSSIYIYAYTAILSMQSDGKTNHR